jgi:hypothetical protein
MAKLWRSKIEIDYPHPGPYGRDATEWLAQAFRIAFREMVGRESGLGVGLNTDRDPGTIHFFLQEAHELSHGQARFPVRKPEKVKAPPQGRKLPEIEFLYYDSSKGETEEDAR